MRLGENWQRTVKRAWSIRLMMVAGALTGAEAVLPIVGYKLPLSDWQLAVVTFLVVAAAFVARLVAQRGIVE